MLKQSYRIMYSVVEDQEQDLDLPPLQMKQAPVFSKIPIAAPRPPAVKK